MTTVRSLDKPTILDIISEEIQKYKNTPNANPQIILDFIEQMVSLSKEI